MAVERYNVGDIEIDDLEDEEACFTKLNGNKIRCTIIKTVSRDGQLVRILECEICNERFTKLHIFRQHFLTHEKMYSCSNCNKKFRLLTTFNQHNAIHSAELPYRCKSCEKCFNRMSTLISHRKTHDGLKLFACPLCEKRFHQKGNLKNHVYTHTNLRPYKCNYCGRGFNQMSNLVCHKQKKHSDQIIDPWICTICKKKFSKRIDLRSHELEIHRIQIDLRNKPVEKLYSRKNASFLQEPEFDILLQTVKEEAQDSVPESPMTFGGSNEIAPPTSIIIKSIQTEAMKTAKQKNEIPFAVLHFLHGQPLLVRCIDIGEEKTMIRPTNQEDLEILNNYKNSANKGYVPIVARIYQTSSSTGDSVFEIKSPKNIYLFPNSEQNVAEQNNSVISMNDDKDIRKPDLKDNISILINQKMEKVTAQDCDWFKKVDLHDEFKIEECDKDQVELIECNKEQTDNELIEELRQDQITKYEDEQMKTKALFVPFTMNLMDPYKSPVSEVETQIESYIENSFLNNNQLSQDSSILNQTNDENDINLFKNFLQGNFHEGEGFNDIIAELLKS